MKATISINHIDYEIEFEYQEECERCEYCATDGEYIEITDISRDGVSISGLIDFLEGLDGGLWTKLEDEALKQLKERGKDCE